MYGFFARWEEKKVAVSGVSTVFSFAEHNQILEVYQ